MSAIANLVTPNLALADVSIPALPPSQMSPRAMVRLGGVLFLATIMGGIFAQAFLSDRLVFSVGL